ncbi:MAG: gliding motility-associated lipoprotein [Prolixibacteraceae bacterium]|nr:MAG: gliding motility-associated lipoprotein [Prolixibacteraceae bacterium]
MKKLVFLFLSGCLFTISLLSCNNGSVFNQYKTIPKGEWNRDSLLLFKVQVTDTLLDHDLYINVRNDIGYKYSNLWLFIDIKQPGDTVSVKDTFEATLADPAGKWLGSGFGGVKTNEILYRQNVYFPVSGIYEIKIQHGMRGKILENVTDVGVRLEKF